MTNFASASAIAVCFSSHSFSCCSVAVSPSPAHFLLNALIESAIFSLSFMTTTVKGSAKTPALSVKATNAISTFLIMRIVPNQSAFKKRNDSLAFHLVGAGKCQTCRLRGSHLNVPASMLRHELRDLLFRFYWPNVPVPLSLFRFHQFAVVSERDSAVVMPKFKRG